MKKLLLIIAIVLVGCTKDYREDIEPEKLSGVEFKIDSAQWTPALIQVREDKLVIYESGEIREVVLLSEEVVLWAVCATIASVFLFIGLVTRD